MSGDKQEIEAGNGQGSSEMILKWDVRLWHRAPEKRFAILGVAFMVGIFGWLVMGTPSLGLAGFVMVMAATGDYWLPQRFTIDGNGAKMRCGISVTSIDWKDVKRTIESDEGIKLSPLEKPSRTSQFRGLFVRYADNRNEVMDIIKHYWGKEVGSVEL